MSSFAVLGKGPQGPPGPPGEPADVQVSHAHTELPGGDLWLNPDDYQVTLSLGAEVSNPLPAYYRYRPSALLVSDSLVIASQSGSSRITDNQMQIVSVEGPAKAVRSACTGTFTMTSKELGALTFRDPKPRDVTDCLFYIEGMIGGEDVAVAATGMLRWHISSMGYYAEVDALVTDICYDQLPDMSQDFVVYRVWAPLIEASFGERTHQFALSSSVVEG